MRRKLRETRRKTHRQLLSGHVEEHVRTHGLSHEEDRRFLWLEGDELFHRRLKNLRFGFNCTSCRRRHEATKQTGSGFSCGASLVRAAIYLAPQGRSGEFRKAFVYSALLAWNFLPNNWELPVMTYFLHEF